MGKLHHTPFFGSIFILAKVSSDNFTDKVVIITL